MNKKTYFEVTEYWLQNPRSKEAIEELEKRFNEEPIEKFILFFFEPLLKETRKEKIISQEFKRPLKKIISQAKIADFSQTMKEIFQEINESAMLSALAKTTYNEYKGVQSKFTYEKFLNYIDVIGAGIGACN